MNIGGLATMTLLDYPGRVAATIFTNGCNFRCPFCQNADLVLPVNQLPGGNMSKSYTEDEILSFLTKRKNLLEGVCITGGEPTLQADLFEFIYKIKSLGFSVKLDSNGYRPDVIERLYEGHLIDFVAMDFKNCYENYGIATGINNIDISPIKESVEFLTSSGIDYEFRTTLVKGIHSIADIEAIANELNGAKAYFLQSYKDSERIISKLLMADVQTDSSKIYSSFSEEELKYYLSIIKEKIPEARLRGASNES